MIFELKFSFCGDVSRHFASLIDGILKHEKIKYCLFENEGLCLWVDCAKLESERLEAITEKLSTLLPQSLFALDVSSRVIDEATFPSMMSFQPIATFSYCPTCLESAVGEKCPICQKEILAIPKIDEIVSRLMAGESLELHTESGTHTLSIHHAQRVYCVDLTQILEICDLSKKELHALASYEKPILKLKATRDFSAMIEKDEIYLSMAHDLQLLRIFILLKERGVKFLYSAKESSASFELAPMIKTPQTMIILENDRALVLEDSTPPKELCEIFKGHLKRDKAFLSTILEENNIKDKNILHFYFSCNGEDRVRFYNAKEQWLNEVMEFKLPKDKFELFELISQNEESGARLLENYKSAFPHLCEHNHSFESLPLGIIGVWEIVRIVLGIEKPLLSLARSNLTQRGVAIEYSFGKDSLITRKFDLVRCVRSGMSFKLAGVEEGIIALGYIESFSFLPSKLYLDLRHSIPISGISLSGDLFASKMLGDFFYKNNRQIPIYRNILFPLLYV